MHHHVPAHLEDQPIAGLYQQHAPKIFDYLRKLGASVEDAEDILVEVFVAALEDETFSALSDLQQQAWLWRVARNKSVDAYRRRTRQRQVSLSTFEETRTFEQAAANPEERSLQQEVEIQLRALIQRLSPLQQDVLRLRFSDDLRCTQIATRVGKRDGTVRSILSRTLNQLRRLYETEQKGRSSRS